MAGLVTAVVIVSGCGGTLPARSLATSAGPSPSAIAAASPTPAVSPTPTLAPTPVAATASPTTTPTTTPTPTQAPSSTPRPKRDDRGCPLRANASNRELMALDRTLVVGGRELDFDGTVSVWARNGSYEAGDQIPQYAFLDLEMRPIVIDAGTRLELREKGATLTSVTRAARTPFGAYDGSGGLPEYSGPAPKPIDSGMAGSTGWITSPNRPGTWVIAFDLEWQTHCYGGSAVNWVVVRTR
jgi:hypothetical protein